MHQISSQFSLRFSFEASAVSEQLWDPDGNVRSEMLEFWATMVCPADQAHELACDLHAITQDMEVQGASRGRISTAICRELLAFQSSPDSKESTRPVPTTRIGPSKPTSSANGERVSPLPADNRHLSSIYSSAQVSAVLRRERARSDRHNCGFAVVLFRLDDETANTKAFGRLAKTLLRSIRETDEIGVYDSRSFCVILPDTDPCGAAMLVSRVRHETLGQIFEPTATIYLYPDPATVSMRGTLDLSERARSDSNNEAPDESVFAMSELLAEPLPRWKRIFDIVVSIAALIASSPLMLIAAIGTKLTSPGPVFFSQQRTGFAGRPFAIYKFRTMCQDAEAAKLRLAAQSEQDGPAFKLRHDPRISRWGRFLRKTSIDELPQLLNVLKGDMTLVGPRPLPVHEASACSRWHQRRHDVTPGLTCTWQVEGRSRVKFDEWMRMDMRYARKRSLFRDVLLVFKTIPAVLLRRGAN